MKNMGLDFKAPKQREAKQWLKVEILLKHGIAYQSCGCGGPGPRPRRLREVASFLKQNRRRTEADKILGK